MLGLGEKRIDKELEDLLYPRVSEYWPSQDIIIVYLHNYGTSYASR